jgi:hypothetical protein
MRRIAFFPLGLGSGPPHDHRLRLAVRMDANVGKSSGEELVLEVGNELGDTAAPLDRRDLDGPLVHLAGFRVPCV